MTLSRHAEECEAKQAQPEGRAKHLTRPVSCLDGAIADVGASKRAVADSLGIREHIVREICAGARPLTEARILALPRSIGRAVVQRLATVLDDDAPPSGMTPMAHVLRAAELQGLVCAELRAALADHAFTTDEKRQVLRAIRQEIAALHRWEIDLDRDIKAEDER